MDDDSNYAVFFFPQALEALGDAMKPYLQDGPAGPHVVCNGVDTGGSLIEMNLTGTGADGKSVQIELMVPSSMVRMIVSMHSHELFGFGPQNTKLKTVSTQPQPSDAASVATSAATAVTADANKAAG